MWKNIKNVASTVANLSVIAGKEIHHQVTKASNATESVTAKMEAKTVELRKSYEQHLAERQSTIKTEVVTEVPEQAEPIN